jgi:hypothetical protein
MVGEGILLLVRRDERREDRVVISDTRDVKVGLRTQRVDQGSAGEEGVEDWELEPVIINDVLPHRRSKRSCFSLGRVSHVD